MQKFSDLSIGHRAAITVIIILVILFALALYGYLTGGWDAEAQDQRLQPSVLSKYERRILELDRAAVDAAYQDQIQHLYQTWMKDEREQPARAATGARQARSAYERSMDAIEERAKRLPPN